MAKSTITITDNDNGQVSISIDFDPILDAESNGTPAQRCALEFVTFIRERSEEREMEEDD